MMLLHICAAGGYAAGPGTAAADFLKIPVGARESALGGSAAAAAGPVALVYNPALLSGLERAEVSYSYNNYLPGISQHWLGGALPVWRGTLGAGLNYLSVEPFPAYDDADNRTGSVSAYDVSAVVGYALALGDSLAVGGAVKHIAGRLDDRTASTWAADAGLSFRLRRGLRLGLSGENLSSGRLKFISYGFRPARKFKAGASYLAGRTGGDVTALLALDFNFPEDGPDFVSAGLETSLYRMLVLRTGYTSFGDASNGISFGLGLRMRGGSGSEILLDYSYASTYDLGNTQRFSVSRRFGAVPRQKRSSAESKKPGVTAAPAVTSRDLLELLYGQHPEASLLAAEQLAKQGGARVLWHFLALLDSGKPVWRASGLRGLLLSRDPKATEVLCEALSGPDSRMRISVSEVLGARGGADSLGCLERALKTEGSEKVKSAIIKALVRIQGEGNQ